MSGDGQLEPASWAVAAGRNGRVRLTLTKHFLDVDGVQFEQLPFTMDAETADTVARALNAAADYARERETDQ